MSTVAKRTKPLADEGDTADGSVTTDSLAQDVADEELEYLEGTPELVPLLKLPRRRRKLAYDAMGRIAAHQRALKGDKAASEADDEAGDSNTPTEIDPADYGRHYEVVVLIEDYLREVAADDAAFDAWALEVSDANLIKTFNTFLRKTQPGEAESSTG